MRPAIAMLLLALTVGLVGVGSVAARTVLPEPTGPYQVGRERHGWIDDSRGEGRTPDLDDRREVAAWIWYPAVRGTGHVGPYMPGLEELEDDLVASGEVPSLVASALRLIKGHSRDGAQVAQGRFPVVVLSPGNATNVQFYASLAEDLASHGYVVVGVDHPYQVTAVELTTGKVAVYVSDESAPERVTERVADVRFVLDRLEAMGSSDRGLAGALDLGRIGIMGHSNGGMTAVESCKADRRIAACLNIDGQLAGGPLSVDVNGGAPDQPFMYLTKETFTHPVIEGRFEAGGAGTFRVVVPAASHGAFADTAMFTPTLVPFDRTAANVIGVSRGFSLAFFDHVLRGRSIDVFRQVRPETDVYVNVYPLGGRPPLPLR